MNAESRFVVALRAWVDAFMHRSMRGFVSYAKEHSLSMSQIGALFHIHREGACAMAEIGEDLGVTSAAVSQMLERLVQNGLVLRDVDPEDRRAKRVRLTERGEAIVRGTMEARQRWFNALAGMMNADECAEAADVLEQLAERTRSIEGYDDERK